MGLFRRLGFVALAAAMLAAAPSDAGAVPDLLEVQRTYLRGRDADRLLRELEAQSGPLPAGLLDMARWAVGRQSALEAEDAEGQVAEVARAVYAFRRLDLDAARAAVAAFDQKPGPAGAWSKALLQLRRGDDGGAVGRLLAPPLFEWNRDAFVLALLGAALPEEDRRMLAAGALGALERCSARGRTAAVETLTLALAALHPSAGCEAYVFALRTLRRGGQIEAAARLLAAAPTAAISLAQPRIALEVALTAWASGAYQKIPGLLGSGPPPAGARAAYVALRHAGPRGRVVEMPERLGHASGEEKHALLIAGLAGALGRPTEARDVEAWAADRETLPSHTGAAHAFLEAQGFEVVTVAGDAAVGAAVLAAGLPFLLYRIARADIEYREVPSLVRGFDRRTGLWLLSEPDGHRLDVVAGGALEKARMLCAVPRDRAELLAPFATAASASRGRVIETALDESDHGRHADGARRITGQTPVEQVYRAFLLLRAATASGEDALVRQARKTVEQSRRRPPVLGFEAYLHGQALSVAREAHAALAAFETTVRLEGPSATVAMARLVPYDLLGDRAGGLRTVNEAARLAPLDPRILYWRAIRRAREGDAAGARADLRRALDRQPDALRVALELTRLEVAARRPDEALAVLQETVRRNPDYAAREQVRHARRTAELEIIENAQTVEDLRRLLRSPEPETRRRIAYELGEREKKESDAAEAMLRGLLADEDPEVRVSVLRIYRQAWLRRRIEQDGVLGRRISGLLAKDPEPTVRSAAAGLLGRVDATLALRALAAAVIGEQADSDPAVRAGAVRAVLLERGIEARRLLVAALQDPHEDVRRAAIAPLFVETATTRGFEPDDPPEARAAAVAKWEAWLEEQKGLPEK